MRSRDISLPARKEGTREKFHTDVVQFDLDEIKNHFIDSMSAIDAQFIVAEDLINSGKAAEAENIWRAQIVFLASTLDFYMHELTKYGLCRFRAKGSIDTQLSPTKP